MGGITFDFFLKSLNPERMQREKNFTIRRVFKKYDKKNKGYINFDDLKNVVSRDFQEDIDPDVLKEVIIKLHIIFSRYSIEQIQIGMVK